MKPETRREFTASRPKALAPPLVQPLFQSGGVWIVVGLMTLALLLGESSGVCLGMTIYPVGMGDYCLKNGNNDAARNWYTESLKQYRESGSSGLQADALRGLGDLERTLGHETEARKAYAEALDLCKAERNNSTIQINCLMGLGDLEAMLKNHKMAKKHYEEALNACKTYGDNGYGSGLELQAKLERRLGNFKEARKTYNALLAIYKMRDWKRNQADVRVSLASIEYLLENTIESRQQFEWALRLYTAEIEYHTFHKSNMSSYFIDPCNRGKADAKLGLGHLERKLEHFNAAHEAYEEALKLYRSERQNLGQAEALLCLGHLERQLDKKKEASKRFEEAAHLYASAGMKKEQTEAEQLASIPAENQDK